MRVRLTSRVAFAGIARRTTIATMLPGRIARSLAAIVTTSFVVVTSWAIAGPASAQKPLPPTYNELQAQKPWTYWMAKALLLGAVLLVAAVILGYLVKARQFRENQRRGGSK
jgi:H+/gluconate symporter-like permease